MTCVDSPQLKEHTDEYLGEVAHGKKFMLAHQQREIARIWPPVTPAEQPAEDLMKSGDSQWNGQI